MGNYICLGNLQLVRGQQVCLAYTERLQKEIFCFMKTKLPHSLLLTHQKTAFSNQSSAGKTEPAPLAFAKLQNNCNELSRAALIYNNLTYNIQSSCILWLYQVWNQLFVPLSAPRALQAPTSSYVVSFQQATAAKQDLLPWVSALIKANHPLVFFHCYYHYPSHPEVSSNTRGCHQSKTTWCTKYCARWRPREAQLLPCAPAALKTLDFKH